MQPLFVETERDALLVLANKEVKRYNLPVAPYIIASKVNKNFKYSSAERIVQRTMSGKEVKCWKLTFKDIQQKTFYVYNNSADILLNINYVDHLLIDEVKFPVSHKGGIDVMFFDCEMQHERRKFPKHDVNPIICIGIDINGDKFILEGDEFTMLEDFIKLTHKVDAVSGYNIKKFDLPYMINRMKKYGIDERKMSKMKKYKEIKVIEQFRFHPQGHHSNIDTGLRIPGLLVIDSYVLVQRDNKLRKLRSLKLKDLAKYFSFEFSTYDMDKMTAETINKEDLAKYVHSDVELARKIYEIYKSSKELLANTFNIPFDLVVNDYPTFIPYILSARKLRAKNYLPHRQMMHKIEGAYVDIFQSGIFKKVYHLDFSSMYPSIIMTYNLSPETIELLETDDNHEYELNNPIIKVWDSEVNKRCVYEVHPGVLPELLEEAYLQRKEIKKEYLKTKSQELNSKQNVYKLILNTAYGYQASPGAKWGSIDVALATTSLSRMLMKFILRNITGAIECDTDGIYMSTKPDVLRLNQLLTDLITKQGFKSYMELDYEEYDSAYFFKQKNYATMQNGKLSISGNSLISRRQPEFIQSAIQTLLLAMLTGTSQRDAIQQATRLPKELKSYAMNMRISREAQEYKQMSSLGLQLVRQWSDYYHTQPEFRDQITYIKTTKGYYIIELAEDLNLVPDKEYYLRELERAFERLGLIFVEPGQKTLLNLGS